MQLSRTLAATVAAATVAVAIAVASPQMEGRPGPARPPSPPIGYLPTPPNYATFVSQNAPDLMFIGRTYRVQVVFRNAGTSTWTAAAGYKLGSQAPQDNMTWGIRRVVVPASLPGSGIATFEFDVRAPTTAGLYEFQWRMVREGVEWFGAYTPKLTIRVSPSPPPGQTVPPDGGTTSPHPGRWIPPPASPLGGNFFTGYNYTTRPNSGSSTNPVWGFVDTHGHLASHCSASTTKSRSDFLIVAHHHTWRSARRPS